MLPCCIMVRDMNTWVQVFHTPELRLVDFIKWLVTSCLPFSNQPLKDLRVELVILLIQASCCSQQEDKFYSPSLVGCNTGMGKAVVFPKQVVQVWCWILTHRHTLCTCTTVLWVFTGLFIVGLSFIILILNFFFLFFFSR